MSGTTNSNTLRDLSPEELVPGAELPGDLRDGDGRVLVPKGEVLTEEHLARWGAPDQTRYCAAGDWPAPSGDDHDSGGTMSPGELIKALRRRHKQVGGVQRVRRHERKEWRVKLTIIVEENNNGVTLRRPFEVVTGDLSRGGFSFEVPRFLHVGTVVYPRFDSLPNRPVMKGVVRSCTHSEGRIHRVGVQFVEPGPQEILPHD